ncbi:MAG: hypothetical protein Q9164_005878 [Protoblastenia rupestris]
MRYSLVALAAAPIFVFLASADSIPPGSSHDDKWGNAIIENHCDDAAYYVYDNHPDRLTLAPSKTMSVPLYTKNADKGGGSIKLFNKKDLDLYSKPLQAVTQFEFTTTDLQYFDISNVNSNIGDGKNGNGEPCESFPPFMKGGMKLSAPGKDDISCEPGANPCKTVYSKYNDDFATIATPIGEDITLILCPKGGKGGSSDEHGGKGGKYDEGEKDNKGEQEDKDNEADKGKKGGEAEEGDKASAQGEPQNAPDSPPVEQKNAAKSGEQKHEEEQPKQDHQQPKQDQPERGQPEQGQPKQNEHKQDQQNQDQQNQEQPKQEQPKQPEQQQENVVWVTQVVTAAPTVETVYARDDGTPVKDRAEKRHDHIHQHAHNKINKRRHGA